MSWKGKAVGAIAGFMIGHSLGAIIGGVLGHLIDRIKMRSLAYLNVEEQQSVQQVFFATTFSVMGHLAKADGIVSKAEIDLASHIMDQMQLSPEMRHEAIILFNQGKRDDFPLTQTLEDFHKYCGHRKHLPLMFLEIQVKAAFADGYLHENEEILLLKICEYFKLSKRQYLRIKSRAQAQYRFQQYYQQQSHAALYSKNNLKDAYEVLGIDSKKSDAEIKNAYRTLISQNHPDKLVAKGVPDAMMTLATEKTQQITKAYELIKEARKS
ncbi:MAG: co-chaperone DjlA [Methylococcales bacterium]|nr:co-chaperone DjlA [Methylococcales bacterium]